MSDRFKFRVWDKINEIWIENPLIDIKIGCIAGFYNPEEAMKRRVIVEQCTGLKDKNGNLIYEGDIFSDYKYGINLVVKFGALSFKKISEYDNSIIDVTCECFYFEELETSKKLNVLRQIHNIPETDWKIIGNIHENPELLEQSNDD